MLSSNAREQCPVAMLPGIGTDGRTDGLTESIQPRVDHMGLRNARAHMQVIVIWGLL